MIEIDRPKFEIGSITNHGQICGYLYSFKHSRWSYQLGDARTPLFKAEHDLEVIWAVSVLEPEPDFEIGDFAGNGFVVGILQHADRSYSYCLSDGVDTPYIHWVHQGSLVDSKVQEPEHLDASLISTYYPENAPKVDAWLNKEGLG